MKKKFLFLPLIAVFIIPHQLTAQAQGAEIFRQEGIASWYGREFEGRPTASGEIFNSSQLTAAHPSLPFGTMVVVTNQHNNKKVTVRVNDRGPFVAARVIDVSRAAAEQLDMIITGTAPVMVESIDRIVVNSQPAVQPVTQPSVPVTTVQTHPIYQHTAPVEQPVYQQPVQQMPVQEPVYVPPVPTMPIVQAQPIQQPVIVPAAVQPAPVFVQPAVVQFRLTPEIPIVSGKTYRLQVGSFKVARNAVETFERLKNAGLNPAYERFEETDGEFFRVVLAGVPGGDLQQTTAVLGAAGFREALIREEK